MTTTTYAPFTAERGPVDYAFRPAGRRLYVIKPQEFGPELRERTVWLDEADAISSELADGRHAPAIDLDVPARLIPSTTEGHAHLYIDVPMSWRQYKRLLRALVAAGVVEPGYYKASRRRGATFLRLPWVRKPAVSK